MSVFLVVGITLGFAAAVQPGPFTTYLISLALAKGWRRALPAAFAPLLSDGPVAVVVLFVLTGVPGGFVRWLHLAGGAFLVFLAAGALRNWRRYDPTAPERAEPAARNVLQAATVNLLNPAVYIGWGVVLGPEVLRGWRASPALGVGVAASFYVTMIACNVGLVFLFHLARRFGPRVTRALIGLSALGLAGLAAYQLWLGVRG